MAFGSKNSTPSFVLTLPFDISLNEQDYLYKVLRLNILLMRKTMAVKYPKCSKATALKSTSLRVGTVLQPKTNEVKKLLAQMCEPPKIIIA